MNKRRFLYLLPLFFLMIVIILGWLATNYLGNKAKQEIIKENRASLLTISVYVSGTLNGVENAIKTLAGSPRISAALQTRENSEIEHVNRMLDRYNSAFSSVAYLMDISGMTLASSNRSDPDSFVGHSYGFRPYFNEALNGHAGRYFAIGVTSGKRGFYASYPVCKPSGEVIGVVAMKKDLDEIGPFFRKFPYCFLVSPEGIIFISSKPEMVTKSLWPLDKNSREKLIVSRQFGDKFSKAIYKKEIADGTEISFENNRYWTSRKFIGSDGWSILLLAPTDRIGVYRLIGILTTIFTGTLILVFSGILYVIDRSREVFRQNEESKRLLLQAAGDGIFGVDAMGRVTFINPAALRMLGFSEEEVLSQDIHSLIHYSYEEGTEYPIEQCPIYASCTYATVSDFVEGEVLWRKDGSSFPVEYSSMPITKDGNVMGAVVSFKDVTDRKRSEELLQINSRKLHDIINFLPDPTLAVDRDGRVIIWNKAIEKMTGVPAKEMIGKGDYAYAIPFYGAARSLLIDLIFVDDKDISARYPYIVREGDSIQAEAFCNALYDNKGAWIFAKASPLHDPSGNIIAAIESIRDITERKQAEQFLIEGRAKLKGALESMSDAVFISDADGNLVEFNEAFAAFHRLRSKEECFQTLADWPNLMNVYSDDGNLLPLDMWVVSKALRGEQGVHEVYKLERRDSGETWFGSYNFAPIYNSEGGITGSVVVAHDITEKLQIQAQLNQAQKMEAIGTLAGGIAHDFNNILGAILGYAEMIQEDCPTGSIMRSDIDRVVEASHRAKELVKQILAFSRQAESEKIVLQPALIIKETMKMLRASLPKTIDIQQKINPKAGLILADPTQIHQIITNLCTNAFHAMEDKGGTLSISLKNKELGKTDLVSDPHVEPGHFVEISIGDTGPGIAAEIMDKIFNPFFTTKEVGKGTGMGLAIIHGIAKKSGGFVVCKSSPGQGAIFLVYLPVHADTAPPETKTKPLDLIQTGIESILLVDDEEMLAEMGKTMLERLGYRVTVKTSSIEALTTIQNQPDDFDLVITDQTMPGMTGSELSQRIRQIRPGLPVILCTGFSNQISEEKAKMYGIKGFAMKPLAKKDLAHLVRKVLDGEK